MQKAVSGFSLTGILDNNGLVQNVCHKLFATKCLSQNCLATFKPIFFKTKIARNAGYAKLQNC